MGSDGCRRFAFEVIAPHQLATAGPEARKNRGDRHPPRNLLTEIVLGGDGGTIHTITKHRAFRFVASPILAGCIADGADEIPPQLHYLRRVHEIRREYVMYERVDVGDRDLKAAECDGAEKGCMRAIGLVGRCRRGGMCLMRSARRFHHGSEPR